MTADGPLGLFIDFLTALDDRSFYVSGWIGCRQAEITRLTALTPQGHRVDLLDSAARYPRPDADAEFPGALSPCEGVSCFFETSSASRERTGWRFELEDAHGNLLEVSAPGVVRNAETAQEVVLDDLTKQLPGHEDYFLRNHAFPALRLLAEMRWASSALDRMVDFGVPPIDPAVSIIVPLHRRIEGVELQLATLADDPELANAELIYVLGSPELGPELVKRCAELFEIYRLSFRVAVPRAASDYAGTSNMGVSLSSGRLLLMLDSAVLPREPGWLSSLTRFYEAMPRPGALAPKLLFEDDSLEHAGVFFQKQPGQSVWQNAYYFKGMHRTLPAANRTRPVPAVTGACMMISRELYLEHNGFLGLYVWGQYEDSDLCLRLRRSGCENWYLPEVELYHVDATKQRGGLYNSWLQTELRGDAILEAMSDFSSEGHAVIEPD